MVYHKYLLQAPDYIHINDIANSPNKLSFRLFADDANIFHTSDDINDIESVMNCETIN